jgi:hypothetical protein
MEFLGTKGKWKQNGFAVFVGEQEHIGSNVICRFHNGLESYQKEQQQYNALLISKAPDMLEMLKELANIKSSSFILDEIQVRVEQLIKEATSI